MARAIAEDGCVAITPAIASDVYRTLPALAAFDIQGTDTGVSVLPHRGSATPNTKVDAAAR